RTAGERAEDRLFHAGGRDQVTDAEHRDQDQRPAQAQRAHQSHQGSAGQPAAPGTAGPSILEVVGAAAAFSIHRASHPPAVQPSCASNVSALLTSNLLGCSTLTCLTTPSSTSSENRRDRIPIPLFVESFSRPSFFVSSAFPSPSMRILPIAFWSRPHAAIT